jgi:hypothetical protein
MVQLYPLFLLASIALGFLPEVPSSPPPTRLLPWQPPDTNEPVVPQPLASLPFPRCSNNSARAKLRYAIDTLTSISFSSQEPAGITIPRTSACLEASLYHARAIDAFEEMQEDLTLWFKHFHAGFDYACHAGLPQEQRFTVTEFPGLESVYRRALRGFEEVLNSGLVVNWRCGTIHGAWVSWNGYDKCWFG